MKFFNIDQHIAVIEDLKMVFGQLCHTIDSWNMSGHNLIFGRQPEFDKCPMLAGDNWCGFIGRRDWDKFFDLYGEQLSQYDGFICGYPPVFSLLYQKFNKPIICHLPIRFDYGVWHEPEKIDMFCEYLQRGNIYLTANNLYDKHYAEAFIPGVEVKHIPSLCVYTGMQYAPDRDDFLYYSSYKISDIDGGIIRRQDALPGVYRWADLCRFKAIVHFPYQVSTMSIFEQYSAGIPLVFPSVDVMLDIYNRTERKAVLEHVSHNNLYGHKSGSYGNLLPHVKYDPNDYKDIEAVRHWLRYADYYDTEWMPHLQYFHSGDHLSKICKNTNWKTISESMQEFQQLRIGKVINGWSTILDQVQQYVMNLHGAEVVSSSK